MENDKIIKLFEDYNPDLSSDHLFINRLKRNLDSVEMIKKHNSEQKAIYKKAVAIAGVAGFITGFLFSLYIPVLIGALQKINLSINVDSSFLTDNNYIVLSWMLVGAATLFISFNAYELSLSLMKSRRGLNENV